MSRGECMRSVCCCAVAGAAMLLNYGSALFAEAPLTVVAPHGPLADYVAKPDDSYGWTIRRKGNLGEGEFAELILTSQKWRDIVWRHQLFVYKPAKVTHPDRGILLIGGGRWS